MRTMVKRQLTRLLIGAGLIATAAVAANLPDRGPADPAKPAAKMAEAPKSTPRLQPAAASAGKPAPLSEPEAPAQTGYVVKSALTLDRRLEHGDFAWNDSGVAQGEILITIDLKSQLLSVFRDGHEIGVAAILYGADDKPTPLGSFTVTQKKVHHISNLYGAPMPYMLRLTDDGVAIHASEVEWGAATHGCIGIPMDFAEMLYEQVKLGDRVIITNGQRLGVGDSVPPVA